MTITRRYTNGYTVAVAVGDDGQLHRANTSRHLLDNTDAGAWDTVLAVLADATLTIAALQAATGNSHEVSRLTELVSERNTTISTMLREAERVAAEHEAWKDRLTTDLHQQATDRDMCSEFDDLCENHGLQRRGQDYDVSVTITYQTTLTVTDEAERSRTTGRVVPSRPSRRSAWRSGPVDPAYTHLVCVIGTAIGDDLDLGSALACGRRATRSGGW
ncbi:MAG: cell division protein ZapB [Actinomycetota bacterium]|nr:cell division protein ZapB [Actinomycetota bacterium]